VLEGRTNSNYQEASKMREEFLGFQDVPEFIADMPKLSSSSTSDALVAGRNAVSQGISKRSSQKTPPAKATVAFFVFLIAFVALYAFLLVFGRDIYAVWPIALCGMFSLFIPIIFGGPNVMPLSTLIAFVFMWPVGFQFFNICWKQDFGLLHNIPHVMEWDAGSYLTVHNVSPNATPINVGFMSERPLFPDGAMIVVDGQQSMGQSCPTDSASLSNWTSSGNTPSGHVKVTDLGVVTKGDYKGWHLASVQATGGAVGVFCGASRVLIADGVMRQLATALDQQISQDVGKEAKRLQSLHQDIDLNRAVHFVQPTKP
jgi:hypothetical protein